MEEYKKETLSNSFSEIYNGYYDSKNPINFDLNLKKPFNDKITFNELFSDGKVDFVYSAIALQNDIQTLNNISNNILRIKTFDYNGIRFKRKDAGKLIEKLKPELERLNELIKLNDYEIYEFFKREEKQQNKQKELEQHYKELFEFDNIFDSKYDIYTKLLTELQFTRVTTPFEQIRTNFRKIRPTEELLKIEINKLLSDSILQTDITLEIKEKLEQYSSTTLEYFGGVSYFNDNLNILYNAMHNYGYLISRKYFLMKKKILTYQEELIKNHTQHMV